MVVDASLLNTQYIKVGIKGKVEQSRDAFNKFQDVFEQAFKIVVDSWKFCMILLCILWDDWPIFYDFRFK